MPVPAKDYFTEVYSKLLMLIRARLGQITSPPLVRSGNVIGFDGKQPFPQKLSNYAPGDFPALYLYQAEGTDSLFLDGGGSFDELAPTFQPTQGEWSQEIVQNYRILILAPDRRVGPCNQVLAEVRAAILAGGPRLGLAYPIVQKLTWNNLETANLPECGDSGTVRHVIDAKLQITMNFEGSELM